jgi:molecular chaperone HtpG
MTETAAATTHSFEAEVSKLLQLMVHSVYSNREIFLRELIANGADACEKLRFAALSDDALKPDDRPYQVVVTPDAEAGTLTVEDNGVGMNRQDLIDNLGTIARSGTQAFVDQLAQKENSDSAALIGQFGVGFYASFMVADEVSVTSRRAGEDAAFTWTSDGLGSFDVTEADLEAAPVYGTRIVLKLKEDAKDFAEEGSVERVIRTYSAHVPVAVLLNRKEDDAAEQIADGSALWRKSKGDVSAEDHKEFYSTLGGLFDEPAMTLHYRAEGRQEYSVLAYVPTDKPFDLFNPDRKGSLKLYVKRVFITDDAQILPPWLRFIRGVIDSEDLSLNLSREMLQTDPTLDAIRKGVTGRLLSEFSKLAKKDETAWQAIWTAFGSVIKEGLYEAADRRDELFAISRFHTSEGGDAWRSLSEYVAAMKENQTAIYYATGDSLEALNRSPQLEGFSARGIDVLLLEDPVDAFWVQTALGYEGKPFTSITQGAADLSNIAKTADDDEKPETPDLDAEASASLLSFMKEVLSAQVSDVQASERLAESPVCLVAPSGGLDRQLEKILAKQDGSAGGASKPVLEVNLQSPLIIALAERHSAGDQPQLLTDASHALLGQAEILDGTVPKDVGAFSKSLVSLMQIGLQK